MSGIQEKSLRCSALPSNEIPAYFPLTEVRQTEISVLLKGKVE
jgi:hypothetical protein